jgi:hypothetical protein
MVYSERTEEHHDDSQESQCPDRDSKRAPPKYNSRALPLDQPDRCVGLE